MFPASCLPRLIDRSSPLQRDVLTNQYSPSGVREPSDEDGKKSTRKRETEEGQSERESGDTVRKREETGKKCRGCTLRFRRANTVARVCRCERGYVHRSVVRVQTSWSSCPEIGVQFDAATSVCACV